VPTTEFNSGPEKESETKIKPRKNSKERVLPFDGKNRNHSTLITKFSRLPIWKALNKASKAALPNWSYPPEPKLKILTQKGIRTLVWQYSLPHYFTKATPKEIINKSGGRKYVEKTQSKTVRIGVRINLGARSLKDLPVPAYDLDFVQDHTQEPNEAMEILLTRKKTFRQWDEDMSRIAILWESICAAMAVSYYIWSRKKFTELNVAPFFEAVGIDVDRVMDIACKAPAFGEFKKGESGKMNDPYRLKESEAKHGKLSKREREKRSRENDAEMLRSANAIEMFLKGTAAQEQEQIASKERAVVTPKKNPQKPKVKQKTKETLPRKAKKGS
jgi:hypothetical protein